MRAGLRCASCDPIVRRTTYGGPDDPFLRVVDEWDEINRCVRRVVFMRPIMLRGTIGQFSVVANFR